MSFVIAAYGLTALLIAGYAASIALRRREARRALEAWEEVAGQYDAETGVTGDDIADAGATDK